MAAIKDGKYLPLPAGLDKEWIEYIKSGKVPPLLGAAALVYPPPRFGGIGVFRHGIMRNDQMMSRIYECWFDQTSEEEISQAVIYMRKINKVYLNFLRERIPGFENAYTILKNPPLPGSRESRRIVGNMFSLKTTFYPGRSLPTSLPSAEPKGSDAHSVTESGAME
jgi:hypothetical protein